MATIANYFVQTLASIQREIHWAEEGTRHQRGFVSHEEVEQAIQD